MSYITREDGERFVIPSYRDVISAKKSSLLKREIILLSTNYGEYITLHRKNVEQYEVAFSPDKGYLLGETVWHYFKRPMDLIYCEAIPNTTEAILVIVKAGSVYLDGSFSIDAIPDELIIFRTQQNNFDIYINGDIPISKTPEEGKFSFDPSSVRSFQVLEEPAFPKLPKVKNFQLQLVDTVLKSQGIGVLPLKPILTVAVVVLLIWMTWSYLSTHRKQLPASFVSYVNPYQSFYDTLTSPDPSYQVHKVFETVKLLYTLPGWTFDSLQFTKDAFHVSVKSSGTKTNLLFNWAKQNGMSVDVQQDGFYLSWPVASPSRITPQTINKLNEVVGSLVDRLENVLPGNNIQLGTMVDRKIYKELPITIVFADISPTIFDYIGLQLRNLPLVLNKVVITSDNGNISGSIVLLALGN